MMAATATARVKEGGREVSNAKRLARRAICFLLAVGACLPASDANARPADPPVRSLTGVNSAASLYQLSTKDNTNNNKKKKGNRAGSGQNTNDRPATPKPSKPSRRDTLPASAPAVRNDSDIRKNIKLRIVISNQQTAASGITVDIWAREREKNIPATKNSSYNLKLKNDVYTIEPPDGLSLKKDYWVVVTSADRRFSGEEAVPWPDSDKDVLTIDVTLYRAVTFEVSARREGMVRVEEKNPKSPPIPRALEPDDKTSFVKGLNPTAEYILVMDDGRRFQVNQRKITEEKVLRIALFTVIKLSMEDKPVRGAKVFVTVDDQRLDPEITNEKGEANFEADAESVQAVEVEAAGDENFSCDRVNDANCLIPDKSGALVVTLDNSSGWLGFLLQWGAIIVFPLAAVVLIVLGVAIFRILLNPVTPLPEVPRVVTMPKSTSGAMPFVGAETSLQTAGTETQESSPALVQHEATLISNADDAAQPDGSSVAKAYSVPSSLSAEMAKEAYKRWVRREKLTRDPVKLDLVLSNITDEESQLLKETNDPGSKFILFTDGDNSGWLFPNPAPSVFQTEVEQTWRLVFKDLRKDEFGRKKERLNPVEARRADGTQGRGIWTAEPKPYEFG